MVRRPCVAARAEPEHATTLRRGRQQAGLNPKGGLLRMATRNEIVFFLNGQRQEVRGSDCFLSLSDFLRTRLGLVGTKIVCSEGDCGACSVLIARAGEHNGRYVPIDACITFMFQLDRASVVTVEGLRDGGALH